VETARFIFTSDDGREIGPVEGAKTLVGTWVVQWGVDLPPATVVSVRAEGSDETVDFAAPLRAYPDPGGTIELHLRFYPGVAEQSLGTDSIGPRDFKRDLNLFQLGARARMQGRSLTQAYKDVGLERYDHDGREVVKDGWISFAKALAIRELFEELDLG
jgi:hypothetical protein